MMKKLKKWFASGNNAQSAKAQAEFVEPLEERLLMAGGPRVTSIAADNRGQVTICFDRQLKAGSYNANSVQLLTANSLGQYVAIPVNISYSYNATSKISKLTATAFLAANKTYRVHLVSTGTWAVRGTDGSALDGEFKGATLTSGNGVAGGDYWATTTTPYNVTMRFNTIYGAIDVLMFNTTTASHAATPNTVLNFLNYANRGLYDSTFFHRSVAGFVIQGGGYTVTSKDTVGTIPTFSYKLMNEAYPNNPGNIRGTIAMAKLGSGTDPVNSATDQWFFNLADNRSNLDSQNGGFTVFGQITSTPQSSAAFGLAAMDLIAALPTQNLSSPFDQLPVVHYTSGNVDPKTNLVIVGRIAMLMGVGAIPAGTTAITNAVATTAAAQPAQPAAKAFSTAPIAPGNYASASDVLSKAGPSVLA